jgi:hypothetical protein
MAGRDDGVDEVLRLSDRGLNADLIWTGRTGHTEVSGVLRIWQGSARRAPEGTPVLKVSLSGTEAACLVNGQVVRGLKCEHMLDLVAVLVAHWVWKHGHEALQDPDRRDLPFLRQPAKELAFYADDGRASRAYVEEIVGLRPTPIAGRTDLDVVCLDEAMMEELREGFLKAIRSRRPKRLELQASIDVPSVLCTLLQHECGGEHLFELAGDDMWRLTPDGASWLAARGGRPMVDIRNNQGNVVVGPGSINVNVITVGEVLVRVARAAEASGDPVKKSFAKSALEFAKGVGVDIASQTLAQILGPKV